MEDNNCVGKHFGWIPRHISTTEKDTLLAVMPLYEKYNNYGEFVFDNAWADAWARAGLDYYPKLVSSIPYSPVSGNRMLCSQQRETELREVLMDAVLQLAEAIGASSFHCLFPTQDDRDFFSARQLFTRHDCQFHWFNHDYTNFDDFLATLLPKKRKNIRQERRKVFEQNISFRQLNGHTVTEEDWLLFEQFYVTLFEEKWGTPTLNAGFFMDVAKAIPEQVLLVMADQDGECIAGSLMFHNKTTLYGRHWGCNKQVKNLHFEACYYQGIEYCIKQGIKVFEPGAQGEHKISRGFIPVQTQSYHWIGADSFNDAIAHFVKHEQQGVAYYMQQLDSSNPYKSNTDKS